VFESLTIPGILLLFAAAVLLVAGFAYLGGRAVARRRPSGRTSE
jgi:hypothetical protein